MTPEQQSAEILIFALLYGGLILSPYLILYLVDVAEERRVKRCNDGKRITK